MLREHVVPSPPPLHSATRFAELSGVSFPHYKYMKAEYAEKFMDSGELRIGTISDFSDTGQHIERVADRFEGARNFVGGSGFGAAMAFGLSWTPRKTLAFDGLI